MRRILILAVAVAVAVVGCGSALDRVAIVVPTPDANGCTAVDPAEPNTLHAAKPKRRLDPQRVYIATVVTNCGSFQIRLAVKRAPKTTASFASLAEQRFYDGLTFHRIVADFVIQGGDPKGDGSGGPGYRVVEAPPKRLKYAKGIVAMAKTAGERVGTSGSQFFVVSGKEAAPLSPDYALLGAVSSGRDVVAKINSIKADPATGSPSTPVVIESIRVRAR
jgi:cyclophilin family peptidyl-prolyl cis-trans isomerase